MDIKFYSLEEVAELFGVNYQLVYKLVKSGELPSVRIGKMFRVSAPQLQEYMDRQSQGTPASGVVEHICGRCGKKYFSALSISGCCRECGVPLCKACVENDKAEYCEIHQK
ncbi:MAG: excisionase family DNA-binding protein [Lentisphaeria bacterium]|jgi:excisionase family DNA binding protein|nr:excisionase family DNA-binding protein [Lentisphaeria bacterium]